MFVLSIIAITSLLIWTLIAEWGQQTPSQSHESDTDV